MVPHEHGFLFIPTALSFILLYWHVPVCFPGQAGADLYIGRSARKQGGACVELLMCACCVFAPREEIEP
jgi:hypothetical protein